MKDIEIKGENGTYYIPTVNFSVSTGICELAGESYLEDTAKFYLNLENWLTQYFKEINGPITFNFKLTYFNTSSSTAILNLLKLLKKYQKEGAEVKVNWFCPEWDEDLIQDGEDFSIESQLDMKIVMV